jgi:phosphatidylglycerol---prolipoprotein diacylglyceryl transferase
MIPYFQFTTFYIGPIPLQVWGFFVALGMVVSVLILLKSNKIVKIYGEQISKDKRNMIVDIAIWAIIGGLVGSRLFHVLFYEPTFYLSNPIEMLMVWKGGLSSFGGLFGAMIGFCAYIRTKKLSLKKLGLKIGDTLAYSAVYGWIIGRIGCFMIHDHLGVKSNNFFAINKPDGSRLDMAFLEILGMIPLAILFYFISKKKKPQGWYINVLFVYYGLLRFTLDFFRAIDITHSDARYLGLTPAQYFSIVLVVLGIRFFLNQKKIT